VALSCYAEEVTRSTDRVRRLLFPLLLLLGLLASCDRQPHAVTQLWAYYPWWMRDSWCEQGLGRYNRLVFFEVGIASSGTLGLSKSGMDSFMALRAKTTREGLPLDVALTLFDVRQFETLFADPARRQRLLTDTQSWLKRTDGIHLDVEIFETVSDEAQAGFRDFVRTLKQAFNNAPTPKTLSAFYTLGGKASLYDKDTLALLDYVVVQGYDAHWPQGPRAGPVAPVRGDYAVTWEKGLNEVLKRGVPRDRIIFATPFFGYEWPTENDRPLSATRGHGIEISQANVKSKFLPDIRVSAEARLERYPPRRDRASGSPYYAFQDDQGGWRQGWFEDEVTYKKKFNFVRRERLAGIAAFAFGYDRMRWQEFAANEFGMTTTNNPATSLISK
jgi:hypothetical protein